MAWGLPLKGDVTGLPRAAVLSRQPRGGAGVALSIRARSTPTSAWAGIYSSISRVYTNDSERWSRIWESRVRAAVPRSREAPSEGDLIQHIRGGTTLDHSGLDRVGHHLRRRAHSDHA